MTKLFQDVRSFEQLRLHNPIKSKTMRNSLTAKTDFEPVQIGELERPTCIVEENIKNMSGSAFRVSLDQEASSWIEELEHTIMDHMVVLSEDWFGKSFSPTTIQRMHCSSLINGEIILRCTKNMASFRHTGNGKLERIEPKEIQANEMVVPIIHLEGLFIGPKHFTPSFTVSNLLACGQTKRQHVQHQNPFSKISPMEEIIDPFTFYTKDGNDSDSNGSFDTHIFQNKY
jgi:hypothetical protein